MLKITNVKVYDLEESVIACRNAMRLQIPEYNKDEFNKSLKRAIKLVNASANSDVKCHDNFLTGIRVSFDIVYPQYWTPEFQRYHFIDIVTSSSKMHRLCKMDIRKATNKYVSPRIIEEEQKHVDNYNKIVSDESIDEFEYWETDGDKDVLIKVKGRQLALYKAFIVMVSNCPLGLELFMRVSTNYKQLQTIYHQRKHHKLIEDWQEEFCKNFIEKLPYAKEFIIHESNIK